MPCKLKARSAQIALLVLTFLLSSSACCDFQARTEYHPCEPYGNLQTIPYYDAIESHTRDPEAGRVVVDFIDDELMRFYTRANLNWGRYRLDKISNKTGGESPFAHGIVNRTSASTNSLGLEFALGVTWTPHFRSELEYLVIRNLHYSAAPVLSGTRIPAVALNSEIKNNTLLLNFYYDFSGVYGLWPYVVAGIGGASNGTITTGFPTPPGGGRLTKQKVCLAGSLGIGVRYKFLPFWYIDLKYRYTYLGVAKLQTNSICLLAPYNMSAISLGLMYIY